MRTLGEIYKEYILSLPETEVIVREIDNVSDNHIIERDIFGWKLFSDKKHFLECRSEEEALYLKIFADAGMLEITVPNSDDYLLKILPDLIKIKTRTDEIIEEYLESILSRKMREKIRNEVYSELTKTA